MIMILTMIRIKIIGWFDSYGVGDTGSCFQVLLVLFWGQFHDRFAFYTAGPFELFPAVVALDEQFGTAR